MPWHSPRWRKAVAKTRLDLRRTCLDSAKVLSVLEVEELHLWAHNTARVPLVITPLHRRTNLRHRLGQLRHHRSPLRHSQHRLSMIGPAEAPHLPRILPHLLCSICLPPTSRRPAPAILPLLRRSHPRHPVTVPNHPHSVPPLPVTPPQVHRLVRPPHVILPLALPSVLPLRAVSKLFECILIFVNFFLISDSPTCESLPQFIVMFQGIHLTQPPLRARRCRQNTPLHLPLLLPPRSIVRAFVLRTLSAILKVHSGLQPPHPRTIHQPVSFTCISN